MVRWFFVLGVFAACTSSAFAGPPEMAGKWSGYWVSDKNGHTGPLHASFTMLDSETYRVRFHGRFAKIIPFVYSTKLHLDGLSDEAILLSASQNLGPLLGTFQMTAAATATTFDAHFSSRGDAGRFVLNRNR